MNLQPLPPGRETQKWHVTTGRRSPTLTVLIAVLAVRSQVEERTVFPCRQASRNTLLAWHSPCRTQPIGAIAHRSADHAGCRHQLVAVDGAVKELVLDGQGELVLANGGEPLHITQIKRTSNDAEAANAEYNKHLLDTRASQVGADRSLLDAILFFAGQNALNARRHQVADVQAA